MISCSFPSTISRRMNLVSFFVRTIGSYRENFSGKFFPAAKHHQQFIINTAGSVSSQSAAFCHIIGGHGLDQTDRSYGDQIIRSSSTPWYFFTICATSRRLRSINTSRAAYHPVGIYGIESFFFRGEGFSERSSLYTSKGFLSNLCPVRRNCAFPKIQKQNTSE